MKSALKVASSVFGSVTSFTCLRNFFMAADNAAAIGLSMCGIVADTGRRNKMPQYLTKR